MMTEKDAGIILVTGATGNIGKHLARLLAEMGQRTRVIARDPSTFATHGAALEIVQGDLDQPETLEPAFRGVVKLFLLSPDRTGGAEYRRYRRASQRHRRQAHQAYRCA